NVPETIHVLGIASRGRLTESFDGIGGERDLRTVVVLGAGERAFSAGANIEEFPELRTSAETAHVYNDAISRALEAVMSFPLPTVAMIRGLAVGGGCELASACDLRVAAADARFGVPIGRLGVTLAGKLAVDTSGRPLSQEDGEILARLTREAYDGADLKEGVSAFLERRAPRFGQHDTEEG